MKKKTLLGLVIILLLTVILVRPAKANFEINTSIKDDLYNLQVGQEFVYVIDLNESIVGCNFNIVYDKNTIEFVKSETEGLNAAVNENTVSCIYVDLSQPQTGTKQLKIRFKALKDKDSTTIGITDAKFRAIEKETSYTENEISNLDNLVKISIGSKNSNTNEIAFIIIAIIIALLLIFLFLKKRRK